MFTTSLAAAAVVGALASTSLSGQPDWAPGYAKALSLSAEHRKPVAVFLTQGGLSKLTKGEGLGTDAAKALRSDYIAVQIDTTTADGKKMADSFGMTEGVVISDRAGSAIALKHQGPVAPTELKGYLTQYATTTQVVSTEVRYAVAVQPVYQPQYVQPQYVQPRPVLNAIQNFNTAVFGQPLLGGS
jgi:hypothetical protein